MTKKKKEEEKEEKSIDEIENDNETVPAPDFSDDSDTIDPNADLDEREDDEFSDEDKEEYVKLHTAFVSKEEPTTEAGTVNPHYRKIMLDRNGSLGYHDELSVIVLERRRPRLAMIDYNKRDKVKDKPWKANLGTSFDGKCPSIDENGNVLAYCRHPKDHPTNPGVPFAICSRKSEYDEDGLVMITPLDREVKATLERTKSDGTKVTVDACGECPRGRWKNTLSDAEKEEFNILPGNNDSPDCDLIVDIYGWVLDIEVPFIATFKSGGIASAENFIKSCVVGFGANRRKVAFHNFIAHLGVESGSTAGNNWQRLKIMNTKDRTDKKVVGPIVEWWKENRANLIRDRMMMIQRQAEKAEKEESFDPDNM